MDNPVYGIYSKPVGDDINTNNDGHSGSDDNHDGSDDNTSIDNASNDVLVEDTPVKEESPQTPEDVPNNNDIV